MPLPTESMILILKKPWPWMPTSSWRLVLSRLPCSRSSWVLLMRVPRPTKMPEGETSCEALVAPGCLRTRYMRSSKLTRLRLKAVVSALARLLATTSMRVESARSPVAAELSAVIAMKSLSDLGEDQLQERENEISHGCTQIRRDFRFQI